MRFDLIDLAHIELIRFSTNIFQGKYQPAVEAAQPTTEQPIQTDSDKKKQHRREEKRREIWQKKGSPTKTDCLSETYSGMLSGSGDTITPLLSA